MGGFFSGGNSYSTNDSYSGLSRPEFNTERASVGKGAAGDYSFLSNAGRDYFNSPMPTLNPNGFYDAQMQGVNQFGKQLFSNVSGDYAGRGFLSPDNVSGVIGSAVTQASPQLMQQIASNIQQDQALKTNKFQPLLNLLGTAPSLIGGESHSQGAQYGQGLGFSLFNNVLGGAGQGAGAVGMKALLA